MRKKLRETSRILMLVVCLTFCTRALAGSDFVYKPEFCLSGPITDEVRWTASIEPKLISDAQQAGEISLVGGLCWKPITHVKVVPQFKYAAKGADANSTELCPRIALELDGNAGPFNIALRNRFEYRMKENADDYWRYRVRVKVKFPKIGSVTPFLSEEVFYEFGDKDKLNGNEVGVGVCIPLADRLNLDTELRCCHSKSDDRWRTGDVQLLTAFKYDF